MLRLLGKADCGSDSCGRTTFDRKSFNVGLPDRAAGLGIRQGDFPAPEALRLGDCCMACCIIFSASSNSPTLASAARDRVQVSIVAATIKLDGSPCGLQSQFRDFELFRRDT